MTICVDLVHVLLIVFLRYHGFSFPAVSRRHHVIVSFLVLWFLQSLCSSSLMFPELGMQGFCCRPIGWDWERHDPLFSVFWSFVVFCADFCLLQETASLMRGERSFYLWHKGKYLECRQELCWSSNVAVIGSPLDPSPHSPQVVTSTRPDFLPVDEVLSPLKELLATPGEESHYCFLWLLCRDGPCCGS